MPDPDGDAATGDRLGRHLLAELYDCDAGRLDDEPFLRARCVAAAREMGARVVGEHGLRYGPLGVTVVVILAESHLTLHTWPERGAAALDVFVCGPSADPARALGLLVEALGARRVTELAVRRS
jgi:S-adenosylmethionine decarboxylase proenzyme